MRTSKMFERINWYRKEYIYEHYSRIVDKIKDYDKISKKKMVESVYKIYDNYKNIISICTTRELKYLKMLLDNKSDMEELLSDKYEWERKTLHNKFLVEWDYQERAFIPDEIIDKVKEAIKNVDWKIAKSLDKLNETLVGYCKMLGSTPLDSIVAYISALSGIKEKVILAHMYKNKVFNYYVLVYDEDIELIELSIPIAIYQDYFYLEEELYEERSIQGVMDILPIDTKLCKTLFYNDFDINNKKIKKFLDEIKKLPFFWTKALDIIKEYALLNTERESLKESIQNVPNLKNYDLNKFFKILDEAMDEMPSGALNGFSPNQVKELEIENQKIMLEKQQNYTKQQNACLSRKDAKLFYKIYLGLLEFTNNKYKIKKNMKIYNKSNINPYELQEIIECFWENKDTIVPEFCIANPYKFNKEELDIANNFKKGFRDLIIIAKYESEYTGILNNDRVYMIKGVNDNIDNIISYQDLPQPTITSIIPFKNVLIHDGILMEYDINLGSGFTKAIEEEYSESMKYYHL